MGGEDEAAMMVSLKSERYRRTLLSMKIYRFRATDIGVH